MAGYKVNRIAEDIKRELSVIMRSLKDPRISGMLSIVRVEVTNDFSLAKIYVSAMEGMDTAKNSVKGLTSAAGYIRHELGERLKIRKTPELKFIADNSIEHGMGIAKLLDDMSRGSQHED